MKKPRIDIELGDLTEKEYTYSFSFNGKAWGFSLMGLNVREYARFLGTQKKGVSDKELAELSREFLIKLIQKADPIFEEDKKVDLLKALTEAISKLGYDSVFKVQSHILAPMLKKIEDNQKDLHSKKKREKPSMIRLTFSLFFAYLRDLFGGLKEDSHTKK